MVAPAMAPEDFSICDTGKSETDLVQVTREAVGNIRQHLCGEPAHASKLIIEGAAQMHETNALHFASVQVFEYLLRGEVGQLTHQQIDWFFQGRRQILRFTQIRAVDNVPSTRLQQKTKCRKIGLI